MKKKHLVSLAVALHKLLHCADGSRRAFVPTREIQDTLADWAELHAVGGFDRKAFMEVVATGKGNWERSAKELHEDAQRARALEMKEARRTPHLSTDNWCCGHCGQRWDSPIHTGIEGKEKEFLPVVAGR